MLNNIKKKERVCYYKRYKEKGECVLRIKNIDISAKMPKKFDTALHLCVIMLMIFGTLMIVSTNVGSAFSPIKIVTVLIKQIIFVLISYFLMTFFANNFTMRRAQRIFLIVGFLLFVAMVSTQLFESANGSKAWIRIPIPAVGEITLQPSEFCKVFIVIVLAIFIEMAGKRKFDWWTIMRIPIFFFFLFLCLTAVQKDFGAVLVMILMCFTCCLLVSNPSLKKLQKCIFFCIAMGLFGLFLCFVIPEQLSSFLSNVPVLSHISSRIEIAADPFLNPQVSGYQLINGLYGFARGGLQGVGFGESIQKYGYLTQSDNDFILSIVVEEIGIFGLAFVVFMYGLFIHRLFYYAFRTSSDGYKIILVGTAMYLFVHFALNVGGVSGLIPLTGVPLLFISSGGSSLMSIMVAVGICQSIISRIRRQGVLTQKVQRKKSPQG